MAADIGKVYPTEFHLLKKELEVQGDLLNEERLERQIEMEHLKMEIESIKNEFHYQPGFIVGHWPNWVRMASTISGVILIFGAKRRHGTFRLISTSVGMALIARAITNQDLTQLIGTLILPVLSMKRTLDVAAPVEAVYDFLKDFSNYPKFMSFIEEVFVDQIGTLTWTARAPGGTQVQWRTSVHALQPHQRVSWKSIPGSLIATEGVIQMKPTAFGTHLDIQLSYAPPVGALGYAVGHILGFDPKSKIDEDLKVLEHLLTQKERANQKATALLRAQDA